MGTLEVNGSTVGYGTDGTGDPILMLHGTTMARTAWDLVRGAVPSPHTWVMPEFPGSGESAMPTGPIELDDLTAQSLAVMDALGHDRFHVAGYSLGAVVGLAIAAAAPDRVRTVTALCGWAKADARMRFTFDLWRRLIATDSELFMRYTFADGFTAAGHEGLAPMMDAMIPIAAATVAPGSDAHLELDLRVDITDRLAMITAPTLIIGATEDRWVDVSHSRSLASAIPGARLVELPAGHLVIQELAGEVAALLDEHTASG